METPVEKRHVDSTGAPPSMMPYDEMAVHGSVEKGDTCIPCSIWIIHWMRRT